MVRFAALACFAVLAFALPANSFAQSHKPAASGVDFSACKVGSTCTVELPGATCGDGTPMFMNVTHSPHATKLYVYLQGGGACWDALSCGCALDGTCYGGTSARLTRPDPSTVRSGWRNADDAESPLTGDYNVVELPYCTGDLFAGGRVQNFGTEESPLLVHQVGYHNLTLAFAAMKEHFPDPAAIVFMGSSAGGLGATFNLHQLKRVYEKTPTYLISDSGVPFKMPFIVRSGFDMVMDAWGLRDNLPADFFDVVPGPADFGAVIKYNALRYPQHRYALIASYDDLVMNSFSVLLGTEYGLLAVRSLLSDVADHVLGPQQKVFYLEGTRHTFHESSVSSVSSLGVTLRDWVSGMLLGQDSWTNVRPDQSWVNPPPPPRG